MSPDKKVQTTALVEVSNNLPAELREELLVEAQKSAKEMADNIDFRPAKINIAPGGAGNFIFESSEKNPKSFRGIPLGAKKAYAFWFDPNDNKYPFVVDVEENHNKDVPICTSDDGISGSRDREDVDFNGKRVSCFGRCETCYLNKYGSAIGDDGKPGKGKACKNGRKIAIIPEGENLPRLFVAPPTSIKAWDAFVQSLVSAKQTIWAFWVKFALNTQGEGNRKYSVLVPSLDIPVDENDFPEIVKALKQHKDAILSQRMDREDFEGPIETEAEIIDDNDLPDKDLPF